MSSLWRYWRLEKQRNKLLKRVGSGLLGAPLTGPLRRYLEVPMVKPSALFMQVEFLVIDFETTGLDVENDEALSVGTTVIKNGRICLSENRHHYLKHEQRIPDESVVVHEITEQQARLGQDVAEVLPGLLDQMRGRVLVAHFARIESSFIRQLVQQLYQSAIPLQIVDTLDLEYHRRSRVMPDVAPTSLRLFNLRDDYHLPRYKAHNALMDAISTAELLLAQVSQMSRSRKVTIGELWR